MQIGDKLASGEPHDGRAPDYDDWQLNGDILFWFENLNCALEISSMGIRVDEKSLEEQLKKAGCEDRRSLPYHRMLLEGQLPLHHRRRYRPVPSVHAFLLNRAHVGEVGDLVHDRGMPAASSCRSRIHTLPSLKQEERATRKEIGSRITYSWLFFLFWSHFSRTQGFVIPPL